MRARCSCRDPILLTRRRRACDEQTQTFIMLSPDALEITVRTPHVGDPRVTWSTPRTLSIFSDQGMWKWLADIEVPDGYDPLGAKARRTAGEILITVPAC